MRRRHRNDRNLALSALAVLVALASIASLSLPAAARARSAPTIKPLRYTNPLVNQKTHQPMTCPDPDVAAADRGKWRYFMVCTSALDPNAFPMYKSTDLVHWYPNGYVFPHGKQPWWALPSPKGTFWAPEIYHVQNHWNVYFAARINRAKVHLGLPGNTMVVGVAESNTLSGPWHTRILHYRGQFNSVNTQQEEFGGSIDPSVVRDSTTGQLYLFWAQQKSEIWDGALSPDGLTLQPQINLALTVTESWECDPTTKGCTIEGPEPFFRDGLFYLMYSGANTWDSTYAVGVAASPDALDPSHPFVKLDHPILRAGNGFLGPGHTSHPITGPDGNQYILYHASTAVNPDHISSRRKLMLGRFNWSDSWPLVNNGLAG